MNKLTFWLAIVFGGILATVLIEGFPPENWSSYILKSIGWTIFMFAITYGSSKVNK